nr:hypothetical protein [Paenibacillus xylanexedens]
MNIKGNLFIDTANLEDILLSVMRCEWKNYSHFHTMRLEQSPLEYIELLSDVRMIIVKGNLIRTPSVTRLQEVDDV